MTNMLEALKNSFRDETHDGFLIRDLEKRFKSIHDPKGWRLPFTVTVNALELAETLAAIELFTTGYPALTITVNGEYRLESTGYDALNPEGG